MDIVSSNYLGTISESVSPGPTPRPILRSPFHSRTSFPVIPVSVIGIIATAFLLLSYYILVIKCCLHWHRIDVLRRFSLSGRRENYEDPMETNSATVENRGLDEDAIKSIPTVLHKEGGNVGGKMGSICECAVCLNEFQENEKLRVIPICNHAFHIDCIDAWLQNNANCPLCRTSISSSTKCQANLIDDAPLSSSQEPSTYVDQVSSGEEDFVVIELDRNNPAEDQRRRLKSEESSGAYYSVAPTPRNLEEKDVLKRGKRLDKVTSMGDECIDTRGRDDEFEIEPIRRSFSMDSLTERNQFIAVQKILKQNKQGSTVEGSNNRFRKNNILFWPRKVNRSLSQPICHEY